MAIVLLSFRCRENLNKVVIRDLGFSMQLPVGWQIDTNDHAFFHEIAKPDDNLGWVIDYDLEEGESLTVFVDSLVAEEEQAYQEQKQLMQTMDTEDDEYGMLQTMILSRTNRTIDGCNAIEMISVVEYIVLEVFIECDQSVINVSFQSLAEDFNKNEPIFRSAIESIKIKRD